MITFPEKHILICNNKVDGVHLFLPKSFFSECNATLAEITILSVARFSKTLGDSSYNGWLTPVFKNFFFSKWFTSNKWYHKSN